MLGRPLREHAETLGHIQSFFAERNRPMPSSTRVQALVPEGSLVLPNRNGTAPGLFIDLSPNPFRNGSFSGALIMLPGPKHELHAMFVDAVVPLLQQRLPVAEVLASITLRSTGLGESAVEEMIAPALAGLLPEGLEIGYSARPGQVDVRLSARGPNAQSCVDRAEQIVRKLLGTSVFAVGDENLEKVVVDLLAGRKATLALAESCTGGCIAHCITNVPGASAVFKSGWVTYSNEAKMRCLGVRSETLERFGAVSEATAREMAAGALRESGADYSIAVTGIAGPSGGTPEKPVGTVFIAIASSEGVKVRKMRNAWDREIFKEVTTRQALDGLRLLLTRTAA
jgi:nicotinamide-nucleotide amidase